MTKFFRKKMHFFSKKVLFGAKNGGMAAICDRNFGGIAKKQSLFSKAASEGTSVCKVRGQSPHSTKYFEKK